MWIRPVSPSKTFHNCDRLLVTWYAYGQSVLRDYCLLLHRCDLVTVSIRATEFCPANVRWQTFVAESYKYQSATGSKAMERV